MAQQSLPLPVGFDGDPTRAYYPRQLIVYDDNTGDWAATTEESVLVRTRYLAVSYRQSDFPDRDEFENNVRNVCENQGLDAYWLDFACIGQSMSEKNVDLYRIADVFRGATVTIIMIKGQNNKPRSIGWLSWGRRLWTIPEALLSQKIVCKVGTRKLEEMDLKKVANHAYEDMSKEAILIDIYATAGKDFTRFSDRFEALCMAVWSRVSGSDENTKQNSSQFKAYPGERVYALMGFLGHRIVPDCNESQVQAFNRLLDVNGLECDCYPWEKPEQPGGTVRLGIRDKRVSSYSSRKLQRRATVNIDEKADVLPHVVEARFDYGGSVRVVCQKDTRVATLSAIYDWMGLDKPASNSSHSTSSDKPLFWIHGIAGSGKSTIVYTAAKRFSLERILGASFFCSRDIALCSNIKYIFPTICYQLCQFHPEYKELVYEILRNDRDIFHTSIENQFRKLIVEPLQAIKNFPPCVIIIDALDECKDDSSISLILQAIDEHLPKLRNIKFLITSRLELHIEGAFSTLNLSGETIILDLNKAAARQTGKDILTFLKVQLSTIARVRGLPLPWPSQQDLDSLAERARGLFIFASTTVKFLEDKSVNDLDGQLQELLSTSSPISESSPYKYLDTLYLQVFRTAMPDIKDTLKNRLQSILGTLVLSNRLLSVAAVGSLVQLSPAAVRQTLCNLHSLIAVPENDGDSIRLIHPSIHDFLTNDKRCTDSRFVVRPADQHSLIVRHCFQKLSCFTSENALAKRYLENPSLLMHSKWWDCLDHGEDPALTYAFGFWNVHMNNSKLDDATLETLQEFVASRPALDLVIRDNNKAIISFLNCIEVLSKRSSPPFALLILLYQGTIYLLSRHWPHVWSYYQKKHERRLVNARKILLRGSGYNDGLYGLDSKFLSLQIALSHLSNFIPYDDADQVRDDIDVLKKTAKDLHGRIMTQFIPTNEDLCSDLKNLLSELYQDIADDADIIYGLKACSETYRETELLNKGISSWIITMKHFQGRLRHTFGNPLDTTDELSPSSVGEQPVMETDHEDQLQSNSEKINDLASASPSNIVTVGMTVSTVLGQSVQNVLDDVVVSSPGSELMLLPTNQTVPAAIV